MYDEHSFNWPSHADLFKLIPHSLKPRRYWSILLKEGFLRPKCVVCQRKPLAGRACYNKNVIRSLHGYSQIDSSINSHIEDVIRCQVLSGILSAISLTSWPSWDYGFHRSRSDWHGKDCKQLRNLKKLVGLLLWENEWMAAKGDVQSFLKETCGFCTKSSARQLHRKNKYQECDLINSFYISLWHDWYCTVCGR